jgi:hypothetical protein
MLFILLPNYSDADEGIYIYSTVFYADLHLSYTAFWGLSYTLFSEGIKRMEKIGHIVSPISLL